jgi:acyl dehydratase
VVNTVLALRPSRSKPERGLVTVRTETLNQRGEVVQELTATMIVPRRSPA